MAPKAKKGANTQKSKGGEEEREEPLQAVIFADAFETKFAPFTLEHPRVSIGLLYDFFGGTANSMIVSSTSRKYTSYRIHSRVSRECWSRGSNSILWKSYRSS